MPDVLQPHVLMWIWLGEMNLLSPCVFNLEKYVSCPTITYYNLLLKF